MIFSKKKSRNGEASAVDELINNVLIVRAGAGEYDVRFKGTGEEQEYSGELVERPDDVVELFEKTLHEAMEAVPKRVMRSVSRIQVFLEEQPFAYLDNRDPSVASSTQAAREKGAEILGGTPVTFGRQDFGTGDRDRKQPSAVYGFAPTEIMQRYLAATGEKCVKIGAVVPSVSVAIGQIAKADPGKTYGIIELGWRYSTITLANWAFNAVYVRRVPVGLEAMVKAVSDGSGMPAKEVMSNLQVRDYLSELPVDGSASAQLGPVESALQPMAADLMRNLNQTLRFFDSDQGCGRPEVLRVTGAHTKIRGLERWLSKGTGLSIEIVEETLFEQFVQEGDTGLMNLLSGLERVPISVGKTQYVYANDRFVKSTEAPREPQKITGSSQKRRSGDKPSRTTGRRARRRAESKSGESPFAKMFKRSSTPKAAATPEGPAANEKVWFIAFYGLVALVLWWGWNQYAAVDKKYRLAAGGYQSKVSELQKHRRQLTAEGGQPQVTNVDVDKVLWTEKFLSIGQNMNNHLWLTDVYLSEVQGQIGDGQVVRQKLIIEGAALPSTDGHVFELANFIQRLEADEDRFMSDFREVSFEGAEIGEDNGDEIIRFTLAAWYDDEKRLKSSDSGGDGEGSGGVLKDTQAKVKARNEATQKAALGPNAGGR
ncbi:MAG: hypothetical protein ACPGU7_01925 [Gammaproteobacteria bacterium]